MSSLKDQLLKAGLVSKEQARRSEVEEHQKRRDSKRAGVKGHAAAKAADRARSERHQVREDADRQHSRAAQSAQDDVRKVHEHGAQLRDMIARHAVRRRGGNRPWHFVCSDGIIRSLLVTDELGDALQKGGMAIVEVSEDTVNGGTHFIVPRAALGKIAELAPDAVVFSNS